MEYEVALIVLCVLVIITNMTVICMVVFIKELRTFTNYFVMSLAVSDVLMGGVMLPLKHPWIPTSDFTGYTVMITMLSGVGNICAVTWDRYVAVMEPFVYRNKLKRYYRKILIAIWMSSISWSLLPLAWQANPTHVYHKVYVAAAMLGGVLLPYVGVCTAYTRIFVLLRSHMAQMKRVITSAPERQGTRRRSLEGKTVKVFIVVVIVFLLSWVPVIYMSTVVTVLQRPDLIPPYLPSVGLLVLGSLSLVNPILYAFMKRDFKRQVGRCLCYLEDTSVGTATIAMNMITVRESAVNPGFY